MWSHWDLEVHLARSGWRFIQVMDALCGLLHVQDKAYLGSFSQFKLRYRSKINLSSPPHMVDTHTQSYCDTCTKCPPTNLLSKL